MYLSEDKNEIRTVLQLFSRVALTHQKVSYFLDEVAELLVALLHSLFAAIGFDQHVQSIRLDLVRPDICFPNLYTNKISDVCSSILRHCSVL